MQCIAVDCRLSQPIALHAAFEIRGFTALLGRSGAGKTSLLKALAGLIPATGTPWPGLPPAARPVGYLPQDIALFPHLTALQNAAYPLRGPGRLLRAQTLLDSLGVGHLAARPAGALSGGEAQRVALARALARGPALLLLDEPSAALDGATRDRVLARLITSIATHNIPALAATHDPAIAALADWLAILSNGVIIRQGTPRDVFNDPQTAAAARLLGYQNIWQSNGAIHAIRAEDISLAATGTPATITSGRELADALRIECTAPHPIVLLLRDADQSNFVVGQQIHLHFPPAKLKTLKE